MTKRNIPSVGTALALAKHLGIARDTMSRKLSGKQKLLLAESSEIKKRFFPDMDLEELFKPDQLSETA